MRDDQHEPHDADFERALASGLQAQPAPDSACPDAETIAAFLDQSLAPDERQFWETHCAACPRCQAHLAALARTSVVEETLTEEHRPPRFRSRIDWRWAVPLATAAALLLAVWAIDPAPLTESPMPTVGDDAFSDTVAESLQESAEGQLAATPERQDLSPAERENAAPEADRRLSPDRDEAVPRDRAAALEPADPSTPLGDSGNRLSEPSATDALTERRLAPFTDAQGATAPSSVNQLAAPGVIQIVSRDGSVRWRVLTPGRVEHSVDDGATWTVQLADAGAPMSAGVSPSSSVCWIVGQSGTILRTVDGGETWERVTAPRQVDLTGVEAVNERSATIDAVDGVSFRTEDGGLTWER